jgi:hypothetical protein
MMRLILGLFVLFVVVVDLADQSSPFITDPTKVEFYSHQCRHSLGLSTTMACGRHNRAPKPFIQSLGMKYVVQKNKFEVVMVFVHAFTDLESEDPPLDRVISPHKRPPIS